MKAIALLIVLGFCGAGRLWAQTGILDIGADPKLHGPFPTNYQEIITNWLNEALVDPGSAQIEWDGPPKPGTMPEKKGGNALFGYIVEFRLNSRNRFGSYTGMQKKTVLIHDGKVIKVKGFGL